ncbi:MAG: tetratricopeptide repeat protein [Phycisphaeraceae bacterium]
MRFPFFDFARPDRAARHAVLTLAFLLGVACLSPGTSVLAQEDDNDEDSGQASRAQMEFQAKQMVDRGVELLEQAQADRGEKVLRSVPRMFPKARARFEAHLVLGKHLLENNELDLAAKQFEAARESEDDDEKAQALYQLGICHYEQSNFDRAFMSLRQVTEEFPWSVYANEAYYYIGQCHFQLGRWAKAVEALELVGTSVPPSTEGEMKIETGQRLFVKVRDRDLVVLQKLGGDVDVVVESDHGDREKVRLAAMGDDGEHYIGSIESVLGAAEPGDGVLQVIGNDRVTVTYVDEKTRSGTANRRLVAENQLVSTAAIGFTDGAYREYTRGVFADSEAFLRVKDLDHDRSAQRDSVPVRVYTQYKVQRDEQQAEEQLDFVQQPEARWETRDTLEVTLTESEPHSGVFVGTVIPSVVTEEADIDLNDDTLSAMRDDRIVMEYLDDDHMKGDASRTVTAHAKLLTGNIQDVKIEHRVVESVDLKARKNLIEAKIHLKLGRIFKEVGLDDTASEKADIGLERVEQVLRLSTKASLDREVVEESFNVKWDLLLVQDKLREAIAVCQTLTELFPDSTLVDRALLDIGKAKMQGGEGREAMNVFNAILRLPQSTLKPEALFLIAEVREQSARATAQQRETEPDLSQAMMAYQRVAETYPDSEFAGKSLEKIADYYIETRDYARAVQLMEGVFIDYPDASFLDTMLMKWVQASYRMGDLSTAKAKCDQLLSEFPSSQWASKAKEFRTIIMRKMSG